MIPTVKSTVKNRRFTGERFFKNVFSVQRCDTAIKTPFLNATDLDLIPCTTFGPLSNPRVSL